MRDVLVLGFRDMGAYKGKVEHFINTTSRSDNWSAQLSPFVVGPVKMYRPYTCQNVENGWQFSKLYPEHADSKGNPTDAYYRWAEKGFADTYAHRYPMGKERSREAICSIWKDRKLSYVEARAVIYTRLYAKGVMRTKAYQRLKEMYEGGESFALIDFDAYDYLAMGRSLQEVMVDPTRKMGHAFVLAMCLRDEINW